MSYTTQLDWDRRESYIWSWHCRWGWSNGTPYSRQLKSCKVTSRELCKQEAPALTVWGWRSCVCTCFTNEGRKEVSGEREAITSLHRTILQSWEVWNYGIQVGVTTIVGRSSQHLSCISAKEVLEGTHECCINQKWHRSKQIWHIPSIWSRSWIKWVMSQGRRWSSSLRSNGATIP
jgi:hypothetical protein